MSAYIPPFIYIIRYFQISARITPIFKVSIKSIYYLSSIYYFKINPISASFDILYYNEGFNKSHSNVHPNYPLFKLCDIEV